MLTITEAAATVIDELTGAAEQDVAGLRLTFRDDSLALTMGLVEQPEDHDAVLDLHGTSALVFLDASVLPRLDGAVLDVKREPGAAAFFLRED